MNYFKILFALFTFLSFLSQTVSAQTNLGHYGDIDVGSTPVSVHAENSGLINIFCYGIDINFNGVVDDGDEISSWWRMDGIPIPTQFNFMGMTSEKLRDFDLGYIGFPFRPAIGDNKIYICQAGKINVYDLETGDIINENIGEYNASALSFRNKELFISERNVSSADQVVILDLENNNFTPTDTIITSTNVAQTLPYQDNKLIILCEGIWGENNSTVHIAEKSDGKYQIIKTFDTLGGTGNHISINGSTLAVTMNGSKTVQLIDLNNNELLWTISVPVSDFNGPRESVFFDENYLCISSYEGLVFIYDIEHHNVVSTLNSSGKAEGMDLYKHFGLLVANPFITESYDAENKVTIFFPPMSVDDNTLKSNVSIAPNPVYNTGVISYISDHSHSGLVEFEIINSRGLIKEKYSARSLSQGTIIINFSVDDLASGIYFVRIKDRAKTESIPFSVIR